jgi:hypothetical protein
MRQQGFIRVAPGKNHQGCEERFQDPAKPNGQTKPLCMNWVCRGRWCKFKRCTRIHLNSVREFVSEADRAKFTNWLGGQRDLTLIDG